MLRVEAGTHAAAITGAACPKRGLVLREPLMPERIFGGDAVLRVAGKHLHDQV